MNIVIGGKTQKSGKPIMCGSALVSPDQVVTSWSCLHSSGGSSDTTKVTGGRENLNGKGGTVRGVADVNFSKDFKLSKDSAPSSDVAILTLDGKMPYKPVKLVSASYQYRAGTQARILGWGETGPRPPYANQLQEATLGILANSACEKAYTTSNFQAKTMVCAGKTQGGTDFCFGDEGGPLLVTEGKEERLAGLASWGAPDCGKAGSPGVYTRLTAFPWLRPTSS